MTGSRTQVTVKMSPIQIFFVNIESIEVIHVSAILPGAIVHREYPLHWCVIANKRGHSRSIPHSIHLINDPLGLFKCIVSDLFFYNNQKSATSVFVILPLQF